MKNKEEQAFKANIERTLLMEEQEQYTPELWSRFKLWLSHLFNKG